MRLIVVLALLTTIWAGEPVGATPPFIVPKPVPVQPERVDHVIAVGPDGQVDWNRVKSAFASGGSIVFNSNGQAVTIPLVETMVMAQSAKPIVLDGLGFITFDGQGKVQAFRKEWKTDFTVQRCRFIRCRAEETGAVIATVNFDGKTAVIDCSFEDCKTTKPGPDIGGGAIGVRGQRPLMVSNCSFIDCDASNGGAINTIQCEVYLIDCSFERCNAFGTGGGAEQGPIGQGGIGGAVYCDTVNDPREGWEYFIAGCSFRDNAANDHAGGMFAYNNDRQGGHIFWNCHFERNTVGKDARIKHAGAIYTQHSRHLWVGNCSFWDNTCPGGGGAIFTALNVKEEFINCEFAGNAPEFSAKGEGLVMRKTAQPPCIAGLGGRPPGPITGDSPAERKRKAKEEAEQKRAAAREKSAAVRPVAPATAVAVSPEVRARFMTLLRERTSAALAAGRQPVFSLSMMRTEAMANGVSATDITARVGGSTMQVAWKTLTDADCASLATWLTRSNEPADYAVSAFWLRVIGKDEEAKQQRLRAGDAGVAVDEAFP